MFCNQRHSKYRSFSQGHTDWRVAKPQPSLVEVQRSQVLALANQLGISLHPMCQEHPGWWRMTGPAGPSSSSSPFSYRGGLQTIWTTAIPGAQTSPTELCMSLRWLLPSCPEGTGRCHLWIVQGIRLWGVMFHICFLFLSLTAFSLTHTSQNGCGYYSTGVVTKLLPLKVTTDREGHTGEGPGKLIKWLVSA